MGVKLDYTVHSVTDVYQVTYVQTHSWEGIEFDPAPRMVHVIAPSEQAARHWANSLNEHGDIFDILLVERAQQCQLAYESYMADDDTEQFFVIFGGNYTYPKQWKGPFDYEHQATKYADTINPIHRPRVVVWYDADLEALRLAERAGKGEG